MTTKPKGVDEGLSVEEFAALSEEEGYRLELSRGRVVREPAPNCSGEVILPVPPV